MKRIDLPSGFANALTEVGRHEGRGLTTVVVVNWFGRLTDEQLFANAAARLRGELPPHDDPNMIEVFCPFPERR